MGCHALLQGIFLTQGSNLGLLHCRQILYYLSHQGSPSQSINYCNESWIEFRQLILSFSVMGMDRKWCADTCLTISYPKGKNSDLQSWLTSENKYSHYGWFPQVALVVKNLPDDAGDLTLCLIPASGRPPGEGTGIPLQYSCLENLMGRGAWRVQSMGSQSQTRLKWRSRHDWSQVTNQVVTEWEVGAYHQGWGSRNKCTL